MNFQEHLKSLVPYLADLKFDRSADVFLDLLSDSLVWEDEMIVAGLTAEQMGCLRAIFRYRTGLNCGTPESRFEPLWDQLKHECPTWIGFDPSRSVPSKGHLENYERLKAG